MDWRAVRAWGSWVLLIAVGPVLCLVFGAFFMLVGVPL